MTPNKFQHAGLDWIPHTPGDPMPCAGDTLVRVLLECGTHIKDRGCTADNIDWSNEGYLEDRATVGWHPIEEQPSLARRVLDLLEAGDIEQAKHELRKELE